MTVNEMIKIAKQNNFDCVVFFFEKTNTLCIRLSQEPYRIEKMISEEEIYSCNLDIVSYEFSRLIEKFKKLVGEDK